MIKNLFSLIPRKRIVFDFSFSVIWALLECYFVTVLSKITGILLGSKNDLIKSILFFLIYITLWEVLEFIGDIHSEQTNVKIKTILNKHYFHEMYNINPSILKANNTGYITGLLNNLIDKKIEAYAQIVMFLPIGISYILYFTVLLLNYHWAFSFVFFLLCILCVVVKIVTRRMADEKIDAMIEASSQYNKTVIDTLSNINTVQKMQAKNFFENKFDNYGNTLYEKNFHAMIITELSLCLFKLIGMLIAPITLIIYSLIPSITITNIAEFASLIAMLTVKLIHTIKSISQAFIRYDKFVTAYSKFTDIVNDSNSRDSLRENDNFSIIELKDVDYSYTVKNDDQDDELIHIQIPYFKINKGEMICIHGESGQGKTTLLNLLSQEINNNNVYVDGVKNKNRLNCVFISQDTEMFDMTLKENLTLGKDIPEDTLLYYLEQVGLLPWFQKQKKGFNTVLGERGVFLSTGQRQRLNLIRGLLIQDKKIYLLDEPTSNVDELTESKMIDLIKKSIKDKTVIIVTHRPKIMEICDRSYLFKNSVLYED